uniref:Variable lymphocyte receptor B cassette n=1 Tax=Petromyzon marinus TaxID=7757 RepID=S4RNF9_PETMA
HGRVVELYLYYNQLMSVPAGVFDSLLSLTLLRLDDNRL